MDTLQISIIAGAAVIIVIILFVLLKPRPKPNQDISLSGYVEDEIGTTSKKRENFRIRVDLDRNFLEVVKIGDVFSYHKEACNIVDISAGGIGLESKIDLPIRKKVFINVSFKLNDQNFKLEGKIIRKNESLYKQKVFYGVEFTHLSEGDKNKLAKEIFAIANNRRKLPIK